MKIGEGSVVSFSAKLDKTNPHGIHIGSYSVIAFGASILTHDWVNDRDCDVYIGDSCFIGAHSIVLPGVHIGNHCIIAAGSVVPRDVPAGSLVAGNPAHVVEANIQTARYGVRIKCDSRQTPFQPAQKATTLRDIILSEIRRLAESEEKTLAPLKEDLILLESGFDSLSIAILIARLEEILGFDPFSGSESVSLPVTLGDFFKAYEKAQKPVTGELLLRANRRVG
jgi:carbonic anhydrase/acetyltransferase-like protein (isoleucine patch superfamily)